MNYRSNIYKLSEEGLVKSFIIGKDWRKYFGQSNHILEQVETLGGIPDVMIIRKDHCKSLKNFANKFPSLDLTNGYAKTIATLHRDRPISYQHLLKHSGLSQDHLKKILRNLESWSVLRKDSNSEFVLETNFKIPNIDILSIEFKLNNWRSALRQSLRHRSFSHYSLVVMPESKESILFKNKKFFEQFGIGSFTYSSNTDQLRPIVEPKRRSSVSGHAYLDTIGRIMSKKSLNERWSVFKNPIGKIFALLNNYYKVATR